MKSCKKPSKESVSISVHRWLKASCMSAVALALNCTASADVYLPKVISDQMILQRGVAAPIWGWADEGEQVTVRFAGQTKTAMPDASGKWMVHLDPLAASKENRVLTVSGKNTIQLQDVLVGEVWLASGQSNMEWALSLIDKGERAYAAEQKGNPYVRAFHVDQHITSGVPLDDTVGSWKDCMEMLTEPGLSAGNTYGVSSVGLFFALKLSEALDVPVAFIDSNWGGRKIESFIPAEGYAAVGLNVPKPLGFDRAKAEQQIERIHQSATAAHAAIQQGVLAPVYTPNNVYGRSDNGIYNAMIAPIAPYAIKGAIWYQGESTRKETAYFD